MKLSCCRDSTRCRWCWFYCGLSNCKVKSMLKCTVWSQCTPLPNRWYWRNVKQPFKITQGHPWLCNRCGIYDFLLALNSNSTSIFNLVCMSVSHLSFKWNWKSRMGVGGYALVSGCQEHWTIQPKKIYIWANMHHMITMHARPRWIVRLWQ